MIKCNFYNGECLLPVGSYNCFDCIKCPQHKQPYTCCLECECRRETCNIGKVVNTPPWLCYWLAILLMSVWFILLSHYLGPYVRYGFWRLIEIIQRWLT